MADKVLGPKKRPRIYDQTEKFYEEYQRLRRRALGTDSRYGEEIGRGDW
jgi:hypothetical protein